MLVSKVKAKKAPKSDRKQRAKRLEQAFLSSARQALQELRARFSPPLALSSHPTFYHPKQKTQPPKSPPTNPPPQARPSRASTVTVSAAARPLWRPGSEAPAWLDGSLPGDFGFDPLALGEQPAALKWYVQGELQNGRWAMLGAAGVLFQNLLDVLNAGGPAGQVPWYEAGAFTYFAPAKSLFIAQLFLFAFVEARRYQDYLKPGSANQDPIFAGNKLPDGNKPGYPGGIFDPMGFSKGADFETLKVKEIKNGRLAMLACLGFAVQAKTTGQTPLANLSAHLADPWAVNVLSLEHARAL